MTEPRRLRIERVERATLELPDSDGGYTEYSIRVGADLDVDVMSAILDLMLEIRRYGGRNGSKNESRIGDWVRRSKALIAEIIQEGDPSFDPGTLALSPSETLQVLTFIGGSPDVPAAIAADLADGAPAQEDAEPGDPSTSQRRSRSRSSRSERRTASDRAGGEDSDGPSSSSTSATRTAV